MPPSPRDLPQSQVPPFRRSIPHKRRRYERVLSPTARLIHFQSTGSTAVGSARSAAVRVPVVHVDCFQFARIDPHAKSNTNLGWPGCCRPPTHNEFASIPAYVWRAVNIVHHVQIPAEVKALLDATKVTTPTGSLRGSRKLAPDRKSSPTIKSSALPGKTRSGCSPQQAPATLSRNSSGSVPSISSSRQAEHGLSPGRIKLPDFDASPGSRRSTSVRQVAPSAAPGSIIDNRWQATARRGSIVIAPPVMQVKPSPTVPRMGERPMITTRAKGGLSSASSSSGSSDGTESLSDSTVVSDGAFTDYLSDESEAELQRQAEARAALLAQTQMEEMEFKAARLQLAHVDLHPPKTWNAAQGREK
ncbi:hypothetical protein AX15_002285 [Amanita polypyramis BW_CC]|nr:hypothetical protein AX15_002285 [Amanita polypyramis BW_CC]